MKYTSFRFLSSLFSVGLILHEYTEVQKEKRKNKRPGAIVCRMISKCHITDIRRM